MRKLMVFLALLGFAGTVQARELAEMRRVNLRTLLLKQVMVTHFDRPVIAKAPQDTLIGAGKAPAAQQQSKTSPAKGKGSATRDREAAPGGRLEVIPAAFADGELVGTPIDSSAPPALFIPR